MAFPLAYPIIATLGLAILSELGQRHPRAHRKSIEACTAELRATWVKEDGVLRVYHEVSDVRCAQIVVECTALPRTPVPSEVDGHPVLIRMQPDQYGMLSNTAGIRGMANFQPFTRAQIDAYNRDGAAQGLRGSSVAPPG